MVYSAHGFRNHHWIGDRGLDRILYADVGGKSGEVVKFKPDIKISAMYGGFVVETRDRQDGDTVASVFTTPDQVAQHIKRALVSYEGPGIPLEGGAFDRMKIGG